MSTIIKNLMKQIKKEPAASATIRKTYIDSSMTLQEKIRANSIGEIKFYKSKDKKEAFYFPPINRNNEFVHSDMSQSKVSNQSKFTRQEIDTNKERLKEALNNGFLTEKSFSVSKHF